MSKFSLAIFISLLSLTFGGPSDPASRPEQSWIEKHESFKQNTLSKGKNINVLFYGDSITEQWGTTGANIFEQYYTPLSTANYGIGGDKTEHLLWRIQDEEVEGLSPKLCVLKIGTNNMADSEDKDIADGVLAVVKLLRKKLPNMKILLLGILPRTNAEWTVRVDNINSVIKKIDDGKSIRFFNLRDTFYKGNGEFYTELYTNDYLHLTSQGYKAWAEKMEPIFKEMLNS